MTRAAAIRHAPRKSGLPPLAARWDEAREQALAGEAPRLSPDALKTDWARRFSAEEISALIVAKRTLARRIANKELLSADESDRALRLARLTAEADRVFGDQDKAGRWLRKENRALNGRRPLDLMASDAGAKAVEELLGQIDHGIFL